MEWAEEKKLLRDVASDWEKVILSQGKPILRVLTLSATKAGLPTASLQYLYFVFYDRSRDWGLAPDAKTSLSIGREITIAAGVTPAWSRSGIVLPGGGGENALDKAFKETARWEQTDMAKVLLDALNSTLAVHGKEVEKTHPELKSGDGSFYLRHRFWEILATNPNEFHLGSLMSRIVFHFFT
jgi:hypothetical protein